MEKPKWNSATDLINGIAVQTTSVWRRGERGFTYIELTVALTLLIVMIPALTTFQWVMESRGKRMMDRQGLQAEADVFTADVRDDLRQGTNFRLSKQGWLLFDLPTGDTVRYKEKARRLIRSVRTPGESRFKGTTVMLQDVYFVSFQPNNEGVWLDIGLQNWHSDLDMKVFVRGRVDSP